MRPTLNVICENEVCENFGLSNFIDKDPSDFLFSYCEKCHQKHSILIEHDGNRFNSIGQFSSQMTNLATERRGIKKLIERNVAEPEEIVRFQAIENSLREVKCTCCLQLFIPNEEVPSNGPS